MKWVMMKFAQKWNLPPPCNKAHGGVSKEINISQPAK